jgi:hypothetical protein
MARYVTAPISDVTGQPRASHSRKQAAGGCTRESAEAKPHARERASAGHASPRWSPARARAAAAPPPAAAPEPGAQLDLTRA